MSFFFHCRYGETKQMSFYSSSSSDFGSSSDYDSDSDYDSFDDMSDASSIGSCSSFGDTNPEEHLEYLKKLRVFQQFLAQLLETIPHIQDYGYIRGAIRTKIENLPFSFGGRFGEIEEENLTCSEFVHVFEELLHYPNYIHDNISKTARSPLTKHRVKTYVNELLVVLDLFKKFNGSAILWGVSGNDVSRKYTKPDTINFIQRKALVIGYIRETTEVFTNLCHELSTYYHNHRPLFDELERKSQANNPPRRRLPRRPQPQPRPQRTPENPLAEHVPYLKRVTIFKEILTQLLDSIRIVFELNGKGRIKRAARELISNLPFSFGKGGLYNIEGQPQYLTCSFFLQAFDSLFIYPNYIHTHMRNVFDIITKSHIREYATEFLHILDILKSFNGSTLLFGKGGNALSKKYPEPNKVDFIANKDQVMEYLNVTLENFRKLCHQYATHYHNHRATFDALLAKNQS